MIETVLTPNAPAPAGHYSQAVKMGNLVFVSGQLPIDPQGRKENGPIEDQARLALQNVRNILRAAGSDLDQVLKVTVYISDIQQWGQVNAVYASVFGEHRPARSIVPTRELHYGFLIEIDAIAAAGE